MPSSPSFPKSESHTNKVQFPTGPQAPPSCAGDHLSKALDGSLMTEWLVEIGGSVVGKVRSRDLDMPFVLCAFEPMPQFEPVRHLFRIELELLNADRMEEWQVAYDRIWSQGLKLRSVESGQTLDEVVLHIEGRAAWFRC